MEYLGDDGFNLDGGIGDTPTQQMGDSTSAATGVEAEGATSKVQDS